MDSPSVIHKMILAEPPQVWDEFGLTGSWDPQAENEKRTTYTDTIQIVPRQKYWMKFEVLRNDMNDADEKVSRIEINGQDFGDCDPPGPDYDCTFFNCAPEIVKNQIASEDGKLQVKITFQGHSHDCDCDKSTWKCEPEANDPLQRDPKLFPIVVAARITLTPMGKYMKIIFKFDKHFLFIMRIHVDLYFK